SVELSSVGMDADGIRGWAVMPMSDLVGLRCAEAFDTALMAQKEMTKRFSSEFGIRHLILQDQDRAMAEITRWADDDNYHVRRLASEGTR
ncbi:MAG: DNA alkylation repair protein, partial [Maricaulis sp.]|nr:DNA alkylation repair protein [Maricaulis sp.]